MPTPICLDRRLVSAFNQCLSIVECLLTRLLPNSRARRRSQIRIAEAAQEEATVTNRLLRNLGALAALGCATRAWALDLRTGVPEGNIEVYLNVLVSSALNPATDFAFIDLVPFNDGTGRLAVRLPGYSAGWRRGSDCEFPGCATRDRFRLVPECQHASAEPDPR